MDDPLGGRDQAPTAAGLTAAGPGADRTLRNIQAPGAKPAAGAQPEAAKSDSADAAKAAKPDAKQDQPKEEKGLFGRMLDKLGF